MIYEVSIFSGEKIGIGACKSNIDLNTNYPNLKDHVNFGNLL